MHCGMQALQDPLAAQQAACDAFSLMRELFPICRSITGDGVRQTFDMLERYIPLRRTEVPSGTHVFDWEIPLEWNIRDAYVAGPTGSRIVDFRKNNLHVQNYSIPVRQTVSLDELQLHLHSLPDKPDLIPYRTTYYQKNWGFCLRHVDREQLRPGSYDVVIDSTLEPGSLTLAECIVAGSGTGEAIVYVHTCHPSLANDNLTGIAGATMLARSLRSERPRLTWRFIFGPGTIGSLAWLSKHEPHLGQIRAGFTLGLLGDSRPLTYKRSRRGGTMTDRAAEYVLRGSDQPHRIVDFEPYGYDERQFCSPGFDLPIGRLSRAQHGEYPEYHTSGDDLSLISEARLAASISTAARLVATLDANRTPMNLFPKGEPRLGKRGLYAQTGGTSPSVFEHALLWVLSLSDGRNDLLSIAERSRLSFETIEAAAAALENKGLVRIVDAGVQREAAGVTK